MNGHFLGIFLFILLASPSFASVGSPSNGQKVRYLKAVYSLPVTLDPAQMNDSASLVFSELVYEGLLRLTNDYGFEAGLADTWTTSPDGRLLTFKIRSGARFHTGEPVTAEDVVYSLSRAVAPESKVFSFYDCIEGASAFHLQKARTVSGLRAPKPDVVEIRLMKAFPPIMYVLAGATAKVLPKSSVSKNGFFSKPIGSGPYKFERFENLKEGKSIVLSRFDGHPRLRGNIDELVLLETDETGARSLAQKDIVKDLANWPLNGTEEVFKAGQKITTPIAHTWIIGINARLKPFGSRLTRQAFRDSIDTEKLRKKFYPDAERAFGYIPPGFPGSRNAPTLKEAKPIAPTKKKIVVSIPEGLARGDEIAAEIRSDLQSTGWNVSVEVLPWAQMMKRYEDKTLQAFLVNMNVDYPDSEFLLKNFESKNPDNFSGIEDPMFDRLIMRARSTVDRVQRESIYQKAADRIEYLVPSVNLFHPRANVWVSNCVVGLEPNLLADAYIDYAKVSVKSECTSKRGNL